MKAHINGITIEGTPEEIMEYQRLQGQKATQKPHGGTADTEWMRLTPKATSDGITVSTPNTGWSMNDYGESVLVHTTT